MSKISLLFRFFFFCLFFAIGAGAMALSFLAPEMLENYNSMDRLSRIELNNEKLAVLIDIYDKQINAAKKDPEVLKRLEEKILGIHTEDPDSIAPYASNEYLVLANKALKETETRTLKKSRTRILVERASEKKSRLGLFYSGAALILIAFVCYGAPKRKRQKNTTFPKPSL